MVPGTRYLVPIPGTRYQVHCTRYQVPGTRYSAYRNKHTPWRDGGRLGSIGREGWVWDGKFDPMRSGGSWRCGIRYGWWQGCNSTKHIGKYMLNIEDACGGSSPHPFQSAHTAESKPVYKKQYAVPGVLHGEHDFRISSVISFSVIVEFAL